MPVNQQSTNRELYGILKSHGYRPDMFDSSGKKVSVPEEADAFQFEFTKDGKKYGKVTATIDGSHRLIIYYGSEVASSPKAGGEEGGSDISFTDLRKHLKRFAKNRSLGFELQDEDNLEADMAKRDYNKKEGLNEGYYPINKTKSYSDNVPTTKIILQHNRVMQEGEQRFRSIEKIYVENVNGERFLIPTNKPGIARVYARHIAEGGTPYDERGTHITSLVEEYTKMAGFARATKDKQFNESAQKLINEGINHYLKLRETLHRMSGKKGYREYFENYTPALMEDESTEDLSEMFLQSSLDPRIENVMPILTKLSKNLVEGETNEAKELEEWADSIIESSLELDEQQLDEKCWDTHKQVGMKKKGNRMVPNCVPKEGVAEGGLNEFALGGDDNGAEKIYYAVQDHDKHYSTYALNPNTIDTDEFKARFGEKLWVKGPFMDLDDAHEAIWAHIEKNKDVAEAAGLYGPFTVTINTGERPQSRTKTKKFRREDDAILWAQDWLEDFPQYSFATAEVTDPDGNVVWTTDESLEEQGVAEGEKKPHPKTWHDVDPKLGKQVDKMSQAEKVKKGFAHPDTLKKKGVAEGHEMCPECGGAMYSEEMINEKKDACYYKVKSRYKVWPSAYASGALVKCRKKGAKNWGSKSKSIEETEEVDENLRKWFKEKWVRFGPDGKIRGSCARDDDSEGKPKCLPQSKAHSLGKKGRASAAARKRREDPNPERSGPAINVATKKKSNESVVKSQKEQSMLENEINIIDELNMMFEDWQKTNRRDKTSGMSRKAVKQYRRENPGSKLQTAVTTKPSKLKKGSKASKRRKSFCARMKGMKKSRTGAKTKRDPNSNINKALRRWNCESIQDMRQLVENATKLIAEKKASMQPINLTESQLPGSQGTWMHGGYKITYSPKTKGVKIVGKNGMMVSYKFIKEPSLEIYKKKVASLIEKLEDTITEASSPAQQAAIAINMKKQGKKPKDVKESDIPEGLDSNQKKAGQLGATDKVSTGPILGHPSQSQKGLRGKLVGGESVDPLLRIKGLSGISE